MHLFRENAAELFRDVHKEPIDRARTFRIHRISTRKRSKARRPTQRLWPDFPIHSDPEKLPEELDSLADDFYTFLECLSQMPNSTDEAIHTSVTALLHDLRYWASCLGDYKSASAIKYDTTPREL